LKTGVKVSVVTGGGLSFAKFPGKKKEGEKPKQTAVEKVAPETKPEEKTPRHIDITCDGELAGTQKPVTATFTKNVRLKSETASLNCDSLEIRFASEKMTPEQAKGAKGGPELTGGRGPGDIEMIIARGNVVFKDEGQEAVGDELTWEASRRCATLKGKNARVKQRDSSIMAQTLFFNEAENSLSVPSGGELAFQAKGGLPLMTRADLAGRREAPKQPPQATSTLRVTWAKDMTYKQNQAIFHEHVRAQQEKSWLTADALEVGFDDQNQVKSLLATGPVALNHEGREAFGNRLEWSADKGVAWLYGEPRAEVREGDSFIGCPKLGFHRDKDMIECLGDGYLLAVPKKREPAPASAAETGQKQGKPKQPAGMLPLLSGKETGKGADDKIRVTWVNRMTFDLAKHVATFYKDVHAGSSDLKIVTDELQVIFDESNQNVSRLAANDPQGKIRIDHPQGTATGTHAEWDAVTEKACIFGQPRAVVTMKNGRRLEAAKIFADTRGESLHTEGDGLFQSPPEKASDKKKTEGERTDLSDELTVRWSDTGDFEKKKQQAVFKGDVRTRSGNKSLDSDVLTVQFAETPKPAPGKVEGPALSKAEGPALSKAEGKPESPHQAETKMELKRVVAEGHVVLRQEKQQEASGDRFIWDAPTDTASLEGSPARSGGRMQAQEFYIEGPLIKILKLNQEKQDILVEGKGMLKFSTPRVADLVKGQKGDEIVITWHDKFLLDRAKGQGVFYWDSEAAKDTRRVRSKKLEIYLDKEEQLDEVRAIGDVYVVDSEQQQEATGESLVWKKAQDTAILTGGPDATILLGTKSQEGRKGSRTRTQAERITFVGFFLTKDEAGKPKSQVKFEGRVSFSLEGE
jgi:lipopolysaccharide export system protein LptA